MANIDSRSRPTAVSKDTWAEWRRTIDDAALALGFPRRVPCKRVEREVFRYCPRRDGKEELNFQVEPNHARFLAVAKLWLLMEAAGRLKRRMTAEHNNVAELAKLTRQHVANYLKITGGNVSRARRHA